MIKEKNNEIFEKDYVNDLLKITRIIKENINDDNGIINRNIIMCYYKIGIILNKRETWGNQYIKKLANDLKEYNGYSYDNLILMARFAKEFKNKKINKFISNFH